MDEAKEKYPHKPWRVMTDLGERVVLTPELMEEIRNDPKLSFKEGLAEVCYASSAIVSSINMSCLPK